MFKDYLLIVVCSTYLLKNSNQVKQAGGNWMRIALLNVVIRKGDGSVPSPSHDARILFEYTFNLSFGSHFHV